MNQILRKSIFNGSHMQMGALMFFCRNFTSQRTCVKQFYDSVTNTAKEVYKLKNSGHM